MSQRQSFFGEGIEQVGKEKVIVIGGGPAGLTAAYELSKAGIETTVMEKDKMVGGISRTVDYKGYKFDIGGHRFYTKVASIEKIWHELLSEDEFLRCRRLSRIYYNGKFFHYPLRPISTLYKMGVWNSSLALISYLQAKLSPEHPAESFEQYITNHFGKRLYKTFFKSYTEKVWGMPSSEISAEWAAQRIRGLSLKTALKNALLPQKTKNGQIKTLIHEFHYPKYGPGMMWERAADMIQQMGSEVCLEKSVEKILWKNQKVEAVEVKTAAGPSKVFKGSSFINTMPVGKLLEKLCPLPPEEVLEAAKKLKYRDFLTVALIVNRSDVFPDNWIYIHDPSVKVGRVQNFKNWSPFMVPDTSKTCLGLEYFCFEGDGLWNMPNEDLIQLGKRELTKIGLIKESEVEDGSVVRMPKAYPVYDTEYRRSLDKISRFLATFENLQTVGRNGMHKYNNQDHSMLTAVLAVENILGASHDLWEVNTEQEYHEETNGNGQEKKTANQLISSTQPKVPRRIRKTSD